VRGAVIYAANARRATFTPARPLSDTTVYTVRLGGAIADSSANRVAQTNWTFTTVRRAPRASLRGFRLRSRDNDRLRFTATLRQDGDTVGRRRGSIRPGATRRLRIAGGQPGRAQLVVRLTDPQGNTKRLARSLRLAS
jgi:hypothetical protein